MPSPWDDEIEAFRARRQLRPQDTASVIRQMRAEQEREHKRQKRRAAFIGAATIFLIDHAVQLIFAGSWWMWS